MKRKKKNKSGFSLVELLVAMAIIFLLVSIGTGGYLSFKRNTDADLGAQKITNLIRKAQSKSKAMLNDSAWGIDITASRVIIFKGTDFDGRTQSFDESVPLKGITNVSGKTQILFSKLTGLPDANSVGTLTVENMSIIKNIQINEEGLIAY